MKKLPKSYKISNPHNIPIHNQGNKKNCTSHAFASVIEYQLSEQFKERVIVDVDDLWEKQKKFGTAIEERGDSFEGLFMVVEKYGVKFSTISGKKGIFF